MTLPLYRDARERIPADRQCGHAGLHFERLFDGYQADWSIGESKGEWLTGFGGHPIGNREALQRHAMARIRLVHALGGHQGVFRSSGRFVTGTGYPHPVENGLSWHPVLGVPYLAGSGVKGLLRAWVEQWMYEESEDEERAERLRAWFGSDHKDPDRRLCEPSTGDLIFFDAVPVTRPVLEVDIMTPHMGKWYEQGGQIRNPEREPEKVPADWHDPTPIPYLVAGRIDLLFAIAPRNPSCAGRSDAREALDALNDALQWMGAGAKTAIGYGLMSPDPDATSRMQNKLDELLNKEARDEMSEEQRSIEELKDLIEKEKAANRKEAGGHVWQQLAALLTQALSWPKADRDKLAALAEDAYAFIGWGRSKKKKQRRDAIERLRAGEREP